MIQVIIIFAILYWIVKGVNWVVDNALIILGVICTIQYIRTARAIRRARNQQEVEVEWHTDMNSPPEPQELYQQGLITLEELEDRLDRRHSIGAYQPEPVGERVAHAKYRQHRYRLLKEYPDLWLPDDKN